MRDYSESLTRILQITSLQVNEEKMFIVNLKTSLLKCIDTYDNDCINTHLFHIWSKCKEFITWRTNWESLLKYIKTEVMYMYIWSLAKSMII